MKVSFLHTLEPSEVIIDGFSIPLMFSLRAAAMMEEETGVPYTELVWRLFELPGEDEDKAEPLKMREQAAVVACLIHEGQRAKGEAPQKIADIVDDMSGLHMEQMNELVLGATQEILFKSKRSKSPKNG